MRIQRIALFSVVLSLLCLLGFSNAFPSLNASAADIQRLTVQETLDILGTSFSAQYQSAGASYSTTFEYSGTGVIQPYQQNVDIDVLTGVPCLEYTAPVNYGSGGQIVVNVDIPFTLSNVTYLDFFVCPWVDLGRIGSLTFQQYSQYSFYLCTIDGIEQTFQTFQSSTDGTRAATFRLGGAYGSAGVSYCRASYYNTSAEYGFLSVSYDCSYAENLHTKIYIPCPLINSDYNTDYVPEFDGDSSVGVVTGDITHNEDGSQNVNITVETDNKGLISGILSGLKNLFQSLFVPDDDFMNEWQGDLRDDFNEHLGAAAEVVDLMDEHADYLRNAVSTNTIYFPGVSFPDAGGTVHQLIAAQDVELQPFKEGRMRPLYTAAALAVDLICLFAVFNMLQDKYEIFLNPDAEVINYDN